MNSILKVKVIGVIVLFIAIVPAIIFYNIAKSYHLLSSDTLVEIGLIYIVVFCIIFLASSIGLILVLWKRDKEKNETLRKKKEERKFCPSCGTRLQYHEGYGWYCTNCMNYVEYEGPR